MKKNRRKAITLLSLVITIIVLLLLAGITINLIIGEQGIFKQGQEAKVKQEIAQYVDKIEIARGEVAIDKLGKITLDDIIKQIEESNIIPGGKIEKLDNEKAEVITKEGYVILVTLKETKYDRLETQERIPELQEGNIVISQPIWNTNKASVDINKGSNISERLQIEYQVNNDAENGWIIGTTVSNLNHGDVVNARLWNGVSGGSYTSLTVVDSGKPTVNVSITEKGTNWVRASVVASDSEWGLETSPTYTFYIKKTAEADTAYVKKQSSASTTYSFSGLDQETGYTVKVEVKDKAQNTGIGTASDTTGKVTVAEGNVTIKAPTWNASTHKASVSIEKGTSVASTLQIQYQVNTDNEDGWTTGTSVGNLNHGDVVNARLWDGNNGGSYTSLTVSDTAEPENADIVLNGTTTTTTASVTATVTLTDNQSGIDVIASRWGYTTTEEALGITDVSKYPQTFTANTETITLNATTPGEYYLHVLTIDNAGNKKETISSAVNVKNLIVELKNYETAGNEIYVIPETGTYRLECWGASGGDIDTYTGGNGAYTVGDIKLTKGTTLYLYIGGQGTNTDAGGYNGGGSLYEEQHIYGSSGGGATDIRISGGTWDNTEGLRNRIMVAAGGGGANNRNRGDDAYMYGAGNGGAGGELVGENGITEKYKEENGIPSYGNGQLGTGGTQNSGGMHCLVDYDGKVVSGTVTGMFGDANGGSFVQSGGGSGYYAGGMSGHGGAGGGSSFISGHTGCDAIDSAGNHTGQPNHYSGYVFTNTNMIAGSKAMKNPRGSGIMIGNDGDGFIRISIIK